MGLGLGLGLGGQIPTLSEPNSNTIDMFFKCEGSELWLGLDGFEG